jgi:hypothetical protein
MRAVLIVSVLTRTIEADAIEMHVLFFLQQGRTCLRLWLLPILAPCKSSTVLAAPTGTFQSRSAASIGRAKWNPETSRICALCRSGAEDLLFWILLHQSQGCHSLPPSTCHRKGCIGQIHVNMPHLGSRNRVSVTKYGYNRPDRA